MIRATHLVLLLGAGCDLSSALGKQACASQRDCLEGYHCVSSLCVAATVDLAVASTDGNDLAMPMSPLDAAADLSAPGDLAGPRGSWRARADMPTPRQGLALVALPDGRLFALGGRAKNGVVATVEVYLPASDAWTVVSPMPNAREDFAAALGSDGRIYAIGGPFVSVADDGVSKKVDAYDVSSDSWSAAPDLIRSRSQAAAVAAKDGRIYVIGGYDHNQAQALATWESWAPGDAAWSESSFAMTTPRRALAAAVAPDGRVFAIGGRDRNDVNRDVNEYFTPGSKGWTTAPPMPTSRAMLAAVTGADGKIYALGGGTDTAELVSSLEVVEAFAPSDGTWEKLRPMPLARFSLGAATGSDGKIFALGGNWFSKIEPTMEELTP